MIVRVDPPCKVALNNCNASERLREGKNKAVWVYQLGLEKLFHERCKLALIFLLGFRYGASRSAAVNRDQTIMTASATYQGSTLKAKRNHS